MLIALALAAAAQAASPPTVFRLVPRPCAPDTLEHARNAGVLYRHGDRPAEHRRLDELPDADMIFTVYRRDARGCPIIDVVQRGVSTPDAQAPIAGVPLERPSLPSQRRPQRQR